jgi:hypothetical protein
MKQFCLHVWRDDQGVLTFEWVALLTLLVIGVLGSVGAVRDAISIEMADVAGAATAVNLSYQVQASPKYGLGSTFQYTSPTKQVDTIRQGTTGAPPSVVGQ